MKTWQYVGLFLVVLVGYLLYTPVPEGITQPFMYRRVVAGTRLMDLIVGVYDLIWPGYPNDIHIYRTVPKLLMREPPEVVPGSNFRVRVTTFDGVKVRLYEPLSERGILMPGFVYIHGGGYCIMDTEIYDGLTREFADQLDAVVVSIEYRLSPDVIAPVPFEDTLKATKWFIRHAKEFGVDPKRIGIGGDSAGGALTALTSQHLHDDDTLPDNRLQVLIYPAVQKVTSWTPSYQKSKHDFGDYGGVLPRARIARWLSYYVLGRADSEFEARYLENNHTSPEFKRSEKYRSITDVSILPEEFKDSRYYAGPSNPQQGDAALWARIKEGMIGSKTSAMARDDFSGLPEAYIVTVGFDPLRDDGAMYAHVLQGAGVPVKWVHYEEGFHGVFWLEPTFKFELGVRMRKEAFEFIKERL